MKTATFLIFLCLPVSIFSQRGYCPCMERNNKNEAFDLNEVLNKMNDQMVDLNTEPVTPPYMQTVLVSYRPEPSASPPPSSPMQQMQEVQQVQQVVADPPVPAPSEMERNTHSASSQKSVQRKKKIKRGKRVRLRARKKTKKYRGGCPAFKF